MKPLYSQAQFEKAKTQDSLPCQCYECNKKFYKQKRAIVKAMKNSSRHTGKFCSASCHRKSQKQFKIINCDNCNVSIKKPLSSLKNNSKHFCSRSCAATYNNTHKQYGTRRSKLEIYLEKQLSFIYPNLSIDFNKKNAINSELDIYIPSLNLAFELNGIYHYEPIHGSEKLAQIQNNDQRKFQACAEKNISLCIIDTSSFKYFKEINAIKFLSIITEIINKNYSV